MRLLTLPLLFLLALTTAGCGERDASAPDRPAGGTPNVTLLVPTIDGGQFVEGFVSAYAVDPEDPQTLDATQFQKPAELDLETGTHELLVLVYPCDAQCVSWDETIDRVGAREQAATNPGHKLLVRCRTTVTVPEGAQIELQPVIEAGPLAELTPDGRPCRIEQGPPERS